MVKYIIVAIDSYWGPAHQINVLLPEKNTFKNTKEPTSQRQVQSPFGRGGGRGGCGRGGRDASARNLLSFFYSSVTEEIHKVEVIYLWKITVTSHCVTSQSFVS